MVCHNYVLNCIKIKNEEELVLTITLEDRVDHHIDWIYKMRWDDGVGVDLVEHSHSMCIAEFRKFFDYGVADSCGSCWRYRYMTVPMDGIGDRCDLL